MRTEKFNNLLLVNKLINLELMMMKTSSGSITSPLGYPSHNSNEECSFFFLFQLGLNYSKLIQEGKNERKIQESVLSFD